MRRVFIFFRDACPAGSWALCRASYESLQATLQANGVIADVSGKKQISSEQEGTSIEGPCMKAGSPPYGPEAADALLFDALPWPSEVT